ncbi:hypothetical protein PhCBS80983_g03329 [Powellomyces hirtus]|uniref:Autophagy-related protein 13 n=1 Tax=Powellomyces hirtus TaxID=109895 RepID=A0A507E3Z5_9FUNG|nr:hypothetical protein PhCBS80983_g03329 [Powellomyces hirtus]
MNQAFSPGRRDSPLAYRLSSSPAPSTSPSLASDSVFEHHYDRSAAGTPLGYSTQPPQPSSRKNSVSGEQRADQIIREVYSKVAQVVAQARVTGVQPAAHARKPNKWFNLETNDIEGLKEQLKFWKANATTTPQPLLIDVYLDISSLSRGQTLMLRDEQTMRRQRMSHESLYTVEGQGQSEHGAPGRYNSVLLESWQLTFSHSTPTQPPELPTVYKKSVAFFRSLYSHVRLLPAYRLSRRFRRKQSGMGVGYRVSTSRVAPYDEAGLDQLHSSGDMRRGIEEYNFGSIETPLGVFSLHVNYRLECDFSIDDPDLAVLDGRLADMDENYFSPRSLGAMRELNNGSPLVSQQQQQSRRDSMSSQRGMPYDNEDLRRTSIGHGSLPRRLKTTHGSTMSIHSQDSSQSAAGHGGGQYRHSPVNIPAGSLPARMTARTNSIGSNASSPAGGGGGVPTHPSAATGSASSRRLSNLQPSSHEKRSSWQSFSPAIQAATGPAFTPPSAGFSLGRPVANGWRQEQPPFCTTNMVDTQPAVNVQPQHHVPFDSQTPPFQVQSTSQSHHATDDPHSRIEHQQHPLSQPSAALPLVRRASMTFATTGLREGQQAYTTIPVFTPSSSATGRPHLMGLEMPPLAMDPADRTAIAGAEPDHDAELGAFLRTLETNRRRLEMPVTASQQQRSGGDDDHVQQQQQQQQPPLSGQQPHQQQKPSRTRMALARFQELHEMNNSFSESLSDMVASQHGDFQPPSPSQLQQQQHCSSPGRGKRESTSGISPNHPHHHPQSTASTTEPGIHILPPSSPPFSSTRFSDRRQEREHPHTLSDDGPHASRSVSPPPPQSSSSSPQHPSWRRDDLLLRETTPRSPPPPPLTASSRPSAPSRTSFSSDNVFISTSLPPAAVAAHSAYPARETHSLAASRVYPQHNYSHNEQPSPRVFSERSNPDPRLHERYASDGHHDDSYHAQHHHHHHPTAAKQRRSSAGGAMTHHHHHHHPHQHHQNRPHHPHDPQRRYTDTAILEEQPGRPPGGLGAEYESRQQQLQQPISAATAAASGSSSPFNMGLQLYDDTHQQQQQQNPHHAHHHHRHHRSPHNPIADTTTTTTISSSSSSRAQSRPSNHHHHHHRHHHDRDRLGDDDNQPPLPAAPPHHHHHTYNDTDDDELLFEMSGLDILDCRSAASSAGGASASASGRGHGAGETRPGSPPFNPFLA